MLAQIQKRDGRTVPFDRLKIQEAMEKAMRASGHSDLTSCAHLSQLVEDRLLAHYEDSIPTVEDVQDAVEQTLMQNGYVFVAKRYILYRAQRTRERDKRSNLMRIYDELTHQDAENSDVKRDNANIDGDTAMGTMLKYGSEGAKDYVLNFVLPIEHANAHREGDIHIHDLDFYSLTATCCQVDPVKLFQGGFSTGHGFLREPQTIQSYASLACIAIQSNQNDQHGGQSIPNFDYALAPGVRKTYRRLFLQNLQKALELLALEQTASDLVAKAEEQSGVPCSYLCDEAFEAALAAQDVPPAVLAFAKTHACRETERQTFQAMEALVHNLNTMHSRAGAQTPFSSINYGTDTTQEGRLITRSILKATQAGLGLGETAIFPIHIFRVKEGINYNPSDPNYDLFELACEVSAQRLFPNFSFVDAPFNLQYYKPGQPETEIAYMGCRTRVIGNVYDPTREITFGRGNLSFTSINLPRIALKSHGNVDVFFEQLTQMMNLCITQMTDRANLIAKKHRRNFPFLMGQGVWLDSETLSADEELDRVLWHGTMSLGFIGLAETLTALIGVHHGESEQAQILGIEIVNFMRHHLDEVSARTKRNYTLLATPAEGLAGRFVAMDRKRYGTLKGITDREYYTNSFHIPVYYPLPAFDKIRLEAPYHPLTNAGHITYVELDGDTAQNLPAFMRIVRCMKEQGIGYGSINHPIDRDPACGFHGIIDDACPHCGREEGTQPFERIRRITGYLVGTMDRWNNAKQAEERDRVKHGL